MDDETKIHRIAYDCQNSADAVAIVDSIRTAEALYDLLDEYNWDDGIAVPAAITNHPACDLAIAIKLYWLAASDYWHDPDVEIGEYNVDHLEFSRLIEHRILSKFYRVDRLSHSESFSQVEIYKFKKRGFPEALYEPVVGQEHE